MFPWSGALIPLSASLWDTHPGLTAPNGPGPDGTSLLVSAEDFGHAAMGDTELPGDDTRSDAMVGHFHYFVSDVVGQRSAIDEDSPELVHSTLAQRSGHWGREERKTQTYHIPIHYVHYSGIDTTHLGLPGIAIGIVCVPRVLFIAGYMYCYLIIPSKCISLTMPVL